MQDYRLTRRATLSLALAVVGPAWAQKSLEKPDLTIAVGPADWGTGSQAVIALQNGYFAAEGLKNVKLKIFPAGLMQVQALVANGVDFANPAQGPVIAMRSNGIPVSVVSSLATYDDAMALIVRKSAGVTQAKQLEGMKIGLLMGTSSEQMVINIAKHYGLDLSKIKMVNLAPPEQLSALATGAVDGICVWQPWVYQASKKISVDIVHTGSHSRLAANAGANVKVDYTRGVLVTTDKFIKANPNTVDAVMRAYAKAQAFMTDPKTDAEAIARFAKYFDQDEPKLAEIRRTYSFTLALDDAYLTDMEATQQFLFDTGRVRNKVKIPSFTYATPLQRAAPTMVSDQFLSKT
jgi:NitT/TauT family transport system substrate-binding protein